MMTTRPSSIAFLSYLSVLYVLSSVSAFVPMFSQLAQNRTTIVSNGTQNHGDPKLICGPSKWTEFSIFFLTNFVTHATTVKSIPGEPALSLLLNVVVALVFPISRIMRGVSAIYQRAIFAETPLKTAARARALCMVMRSPSWKPETCTKHLNT